MFNWFTLLYTWNYHNMVRQLYSNKESFLRAYYKAAPRGATARRWKAHIPELNGSEKTHQHFNSGYFRMVGGFGIHFDSFLCVYLLFFFCPESIHHLYKTVRPTHCAPCFKQTPGCVTWSRQLVLHSLPTQVVLPPCLCLPVGASTA